MSVVHDNLQRASGHVRMWHLRVADGSVYGPVNLSVLCEWAAQSRIVPGNEISENNRDWIPVENLPELKLDWTAELGDGKTYGPFSVLAVPYLYNSGTLPADARITNRHSGKILMVGELLKSSGAAAAGAVEVKTRQIPVSGMDRQWEEKYKEEKRMRLLHEAQLQQTIDKLTVDGKQPEEAQPVAVDKVTASDEVPEKTRAVEGQLRQTIERMEEEARSLRNRFENAERDLAEFRKQGESTSKQAAGSDDRLRRELQIASTSLETAKKDLSDERRNMEAVKRQAQLREQELARQIEEIRKEAESRAGMLEKINHDLQATESAKSGGMARAKEEEGRLKGQIEKLEKESQNATRETAELRKRAQMLEKEMAQKESKLQVQTLEYKKKYDQVAADLERFKKDTESHKSLHAETEKSFSDREAGLRREALFARSAAVKAEQEIASLKKQYETLREQSSQKESDLVHRLDQLQIQFQKSGDDVMRLNREVEGRRDVYQGLEKRAVTAEGQLPALQARLAEVEPELERFKKEAGQKEEAVTQFAGELAKERSLRNELKTRLDAEQADARSRTAKLENELHRLTEALSAAGEKELVVARALDEAKRTITASDETISKTREQANKEIASLKSHNDKLTGDVRKLESELKMSRHELASLTTELHEARKVVGTEGEELARSRDQFTKEIAGLKAQGDNMQAECRRLEAELKKSKQTESSLMTELQEARRIIAEENERIAKARDQFTKDTASLKSHQEKSESDCRKLEAELQSTRQSAAALATQLEEERRAASSEKNALVASGKNLAEEATTLKGRLVGSITEINELKKVIQDLKQAYSVSRSDTEEQAWARKQFEEEIAERISDYEKLEKKHTELSDRAETLARKSSALSDELQELRETNKNLERDLKHAISEKEREEKVLIKNEHESSSTAEKCRHLQEALDAKERELAVALKQLEKEGKLLHSVEGDRSALEEQLAKELQLLKDQGEWAAQQLKEEQQRFLKLEADAAAERSTHSDRIRLLEADKKTLSDEVRKTKAILTAIEEKDTKEIARLKKQVERTEEAAASVGEGLGVDLARERAVREEVARKAAEAEARIRQLEEENGFQAKSVKDLEKKLAGQKSDNDSMSKKLGAAATEDERLRTELAKLRQQHETLQTLIKTQGKGQAEPVEAQAPLKAPVAAKPLWFRRTATAALLIICLVASFEAGARRKPKATPVVARPVTSVDAVPAVKEEPVLPVLETVKAPEWPKVVVNGVNVTVGEKECVMIFESGLFTYRTNFAAEPARALGEVASQIRGKMAGLKLIVEGHSDATPFSSDASNNYKLSLLRAKVVVDLLAGKYEIPAELIEATSKGEDDPPFSNEDEVSRRKNRTVVLKLVPRR